MRTLFARDRAVFLGRLPHLLPRVGFVLAVIVFALLVSDSRWRSKLQAGVAALSGKSFPVPKPARAHDYADPENVPLSFRAANMELYVRMSYERGWNETKSVLLPSLQLFWPHVSIVICLDAEAKADQEAVHDIAKQVAKEFPPLKARSVLVADYPLLKRGMKKDYRGWHRGQLDMMFADMVVKARHVALCDTDALFATLVTPQALFSASGKPIVIASLGRERWSLWATAAAATQLYLKKNAVMNCMSFFPVILVTRHIREMRDYVEKIHGKSFVEVYKEVYEKVGFYCHFTIMCNYVWHFHQNMYQFRYHKAEPGWDKPRPNVIKNFSFVNEHNSKPIVRVSTHLSWTQFGDVPFVEAYLKRGKNRIGHLKNRYDPMISSPILAHSFCCVCLALCENVHSKECASLTKACSLIGVNKDKLQVALFRFEAGQTWESSPNLLDAQKSYYKALKYYSSWISYGKWIMFRFHPVVYEKLHL